MPERKKHQQGSLLLRQGSIPTLHNFLDGPLTPVPSWKLRQNPSYYPSVNSEEHEKLCVQKEKVLAGHGGHAPRLPFLSARKLAASLWEDLQDQGHGDVGDFSESSPRSHLHSRPSSLSNSESPDLSANHHQVLTKHQQTARSFYHPPSLSPPLKAITLMHPKVGGPHAQVQSSGFMATDSCQREAVEQPDNLQDTCKLADSGPITNTHDRVKASDGIQLRTTYIENPLVESLSDELKQALSRVQQFEAAQISVGKEVDGLLRRCADEIILLRTREQENIQDVILFITEEVDKEQKVRKSLEMENQSLGMEIEKISHRLMEASKVIEATEQELDKERKARQLMEDVCNELAKEIGQDKAEVEELKRELAKAKEEVEEERKVIQMTEAWREERVQMKLSEAKLELEEKCMALDALKIELEMYLKRGTVNRTGAFVDRVGESLRDAVEKVNLKTSGSMFFAKGARPCVPLQENSVSSDHMGSPTDQSSTHDHAHASKSIERGMHSVPDGGDYFSWDMDRLGGEECDSVQSTSPHLKEHHIQFTNFTPPSRWEIERAIKKSYGSKTRGLSSLAYKDLGEGNDGARGQWDCARNCRSGYREKGNWSSDGDSDTGQSDIASWSTSGVEDEKGSRFSPDFRRMMNRPFEKSSSRGRHGAARVKQKYGGQVVRRIGHGYDASVVRVPLFSRKHTMVDVEDESGFSSVGECSPSYEGHMASPHQKGSVDLSKQSVSLRRRAYYRPVDWSKPVRGNSLQAKLLLEDNE